MALRRSARLCDRIHSRPPLPLAFCQSAEDMHPFRPTGGSWVLLWSRMPHYPCELPFTCERWSACVSIATRRNANTPRLGRRRRRDKVMSGRAHNAFCCVRPPGHHAEPDRAMGFCFFNNAPIGALHAQVRRLRSMHTWCGVQRRRKFLFVTPWHCRRCCI